MCKACQRLKKQLVRSERGRLTAVNRWKTVLSEYKEIDCVANSAIHRLRAQLAAQEAEIQSLRQSAAH